MDADAVIQRRTAGFAVLFVQGNHGLTGFGHGMQQICAGRRLAERKNGEQTIADEFQYFPAMSRNWLRHRVEIAVQKVNDVIARPVVEILVKSRKSQIMMAARTVVPLPRRV